MTRRAALLLAGILTVSSPALTACSDPLPPNTDPRAGVVWIEDSDCLLGDCYALTKVCMGPDLVYKDTRLDENEERVFEASPECEGHPK